MHVIAFVLALALAAALAGVRLWLEARRAVAALRRSHETLEARVTERTTALKRALAAADAQARRLAAADRAKADFLLALGRELRQPLGVVTGFAQILRLNASGDPLTRRQDEALIRIEASAAGLLALVDDVVDFAMAQAPKPGLSMQRVDLRLAVRQACDGLAAQAHAAGVTLDCPAPASGLGVEADPTRLRQILRRLIADAVRRTAPGGTVRIELRRARDQVAVLVHDAGFEAPEDRLEALFQPFNHVERNAPPGAGVGLSAAQKLAEAMNGRLIAARRRDAGVTFTLRLPAAGPAPEALPPAALLYVEDDAVSQVLMRQVAATLGLTLHAASTGPEGLALAQALQPDVILLDIGLPGMDGYELKRRLDADPVTRGLPVLALTAAAMPQDVERGRAAGFHAYLTKPLDVEALTAMLGEALATRRPLSSTA